MIVAVEVRQKVLRSLGNINNTFISNRQYSRNKFSKISKIIMKKQLYQLTCLHTLLLKLINLFYVF